MELQGMSDETYQQILKDIEEIRYLIIKYGGMATKTLTESVLMDKYGLNRSDAHSLANSGEYHNARDFHLPGPVWAAKRPEPQLCKFPILATFLQGHFIADQARIIASVEHWQVARDHVVEPGNDQWLTEAIDKAADEYQQLDRKIDKLLDYRHEQIIA